MAASSAVSALEASGVPAGGKVIVLEKMPRVGRKIMITGKGRCNFSNLKNWNEFSGYICSNAKFPKNAFMSMPPARLQEWFESHGCEAVLERGDRLFPASGTATTIVDTLVSAASGAEIITGAEVSSVEACGSEGFHLTTSDGREFSCAKLIITTGGLSYPATGSTGDGYSFARALGHKITQTFPTLTALVPRGYKVVSGPSSSLKGHISRNEPLSALGEALNGVNLENVELTLNVDGNEADIQFGDLSFTDGGLEGPIGYKVSRKAVKAMLNGGKVSVTIDLKPSLTYEKLVGKITSLFNNSSSRGPKTNKPDRVLESLLPKEVAKAFVASTGLDHFTPERLAKTLKAWQIPIEGYVGYERAVVTAGGVSLDEVLPKTLESRLVPGLYFAGEVLDIDALTGGYNLQLAFCTGHLAGESAAK